uniref:START domain-containing protein n=2 Tax=Timema TaxID=61471 RepID=A0A7R9AR47_TIMSH|nr:unnamed protein product [Timema shepardi]CAD7577156.1 unnamed protein product [Timema californicum]
MARLVFSLNETSHNPTQTRHNGGTLCTMVPGRDPDSRDEECVDKAKKALENSWQVLNSGDWKLEKQTPEGDTVHSRVLPIIGKIFKLAMLDDYTDITYQVTREVAGGLISSRDFINLRHYAVKDGRHIAAGTGMEHPDFPANIKYIRGENGPNCWVMSPIPEDDKHCTFQWLLNTNLHGWLPQYAVDSALITALTDYIGYIRAYASKLRQEGEL